MFQPVRLGGIKVYTENVGRDKIVIDMDIAYAGDCNFVVSVGGFKAGLNNLQVKHSHTHSSNEADKDINKTRLVQRQNASDYEAVV